ncbi:MAG TPA: 2-C-methyl-D-erythritol 4-phosphate cytidylyltransferase [Opitutaceae bacterium]|nr:2-C-methyl-D-erythritol 4-phosphate cytidylyltransferase [Opitutaceae bacterium]
MTGALILLCAGRGKRMRRAVADKTLARVAGRTVFARAVGAFVRAKVVGQIVIAHRSPAQKRRLAAELARVKGSARLTVSWVRGGAERQDSVVAGIAALTDDKGLVFIHDCARPLVAPLQIRRLAAAARKHGAAVLAHRVTDTIKKTKKPPGRAVRLKTINRDHLWAVETPQAFDRRLIVRAYDLVKQRGVRVTDDTQAVEIAGGWIAIVENPDPNPKITSPADIALVEHLLAHHKAT